MPRQPKPRPVGRPKMPKGAAKAKAIQVRLDAENIKRVESAAKSTKQTVSDWIRSAINASLPA